MDRFKQLWAPITTIAGAVLLTLQIIEAFDGKRTLFTGLLTIVSLIALGAGIWEYAFAPSTIEGFPRYKFHWIAKIILLLISLAVIISVIYILTILHAVPDCCDFLPTSTLTSTSSPTLTLAIPPATFTVIPSDTPTFTLTPTNTSLPTSTNTDMPSATPDMTIYKGFDKNCIDQKYWVLVSSEVVPTYKQNAKICLDLSAKGVASQDEGLRFNASPLDYPLFGMYTVLPSHGDVEVHLKLQIDEFKSWTNSIDSILVLGVSNSEDVNFKSGEFLFHSIRGAYKTDDIIREVGSNKTQAALQWTPNVTNGEMYDIVFSIHGIELTITINNKTLKYYPRSLSRFGDNKVFWIGYHLPVGKSSLKASITEFTVIEK